MADSLKPQYDELVARWSALAPERREELLAEFVPDYVYNSEKIENAELTYATVKQIVETGSVTRDLQPQALLGPRARQAR